MLTEQALKNPYTEGSIVHQNFNGALSFYASLTDEKLNELLKENRAKADDFLNYNLEQMDHFERECRAIKIVFDSRKAA